MKLKERIPNDVTLIETVGQDIAGITEGIRAEVGTLEADYIKYRRHQKIGLAIIIFAFLAPNMVSSIGLFSDWGAISFTIGIISFIICIIFAIKLMVTGSEVIYFFNSGVNNVLYEKIFRILGVSGQLVKREFTTPTANKNPLLRLLGNNIASNPGLGRTMEALNHSELITSAFNRTNVDNSYDIAIDNSNLYVSELDVKHESGSGKNRTVVQVFKGYFVSFQLERILEGKTFISTEGDELGFGHRSFFTDMGKRGIKETKLEWNQFEDKLHVATDNEVEARYILTTDFMNDLYSWWQGQKGHIRISFVGDHMYMLFPDGKIRFDNTISKIGEKQVQDYLLTIAKPLLHVVHLAEDVRL